MKKMLILLTASVLAIVVLAIILLWEPDNERAGLELSFSNAQLTPEQPRQPTKRFRPDMAMAALSEQEREKMIDRAADGEEQRLIELGREFHDKWYDDRRRLGEERHRQMEKLWFHGRRPRGHADSISRLEQLLREFPDTNRAGCAAYELGHHYLKRSGLSAEESQRRAEEYFRLAEERYRDSLCEFNAPVAAMSRLALAVWVYKSSDPRLARRLLQQVVEQDGDKTDHLGQPLSEVARKLLETIPP